jgi:antitoxin MazE
MYVNLVQWGNSAAIRIPKIVLEQLNVDSTNLVDVSFELSVEGDRLLLTKQQNKTKFQILAEQAINKQYNPKEDIDWGEPVGKEIW